LWRYFKFVFLGSTFPESRKITIIKALDNVSLNIYSGEFFGLYGKNGSGKTTLLLILGTVVLPDKGEIEIFGLDYYKNLDEIRKYVVPIFGWMKGLRQTLTARQNIELELMFHNIDPSRVKGEINALAKEFEIYNRLDDRLERFSSGMIIKVALVSALIVLSKYDKALVLCDEPFIGLDIVTLSKLKKKLRKYCSKDLTLILATHQTTDLETLCDRVAILDRGKILAVDTVENLKKKIIGEEKIIIEYSTTNRPVNLEGLNGIENVISVEPVNSLDNRNVYVQRQVINLSRPIKQTNSPAVNKVIITVKDSRRVLSKIIDYLIVNGAKIRYIKVEEPSMESILVKLTQEVKEKWN